MEAAGLFLLQPAAALPVSVDEIKMHLRLDTDEEDDYLTGLIRAATMYAEQFMGRALITQRLSATFDGFPACDLLPLPRPRLQSVEQVRYRDRDQELVTLDAANYEPCTNIEPGALMPTAAGDWRWPISSKRRGSLQIDFTAGYGDDPEDVPDTIRHAIKFYVAHLYANREAVIAEMMRPIPLGIQNLLWMHRIAPIG